VRPLIYLAIEQISSLRDYPDVSKGGTAMAYPYRSILSPIQFDDPSLMALDYAKQIAADHSATLHLLHVAHKIPAFGEPDVSENEHTSPEEERPATRSRRLPANIWAASNTRAIRLRHRRARLLKLSCKSRLSSRPTSSCSRRTAERAYRT